MKIKSEHIIKRKVFAEIREPKLIVDIEELNQYLIYHTYNLSKPGTNIWKTTRMISLYQKNDLKLISHMKIKYPINDYCIGETPNIIYIATGCYDGGYSYGGELLRWDFEIGHLTKVVEDQREFRAIELIANEIEAIVLPTDDGAEDQSVKRYSIPLGLPNSKLLDFIFEVVVESPEDNFALDTTRNIESCEYQLTQIALNHDESYSHYFSANAIEFIERNKLLVGYNYSQFVEFSIDKRTKKEYKIEESAHCYQIIPLEKNGSILLNFIPIYPPDNIVYELTEEDSISKIEYLKGLLYKNRGEGILAKQIIPYPNGEEHLEEYFNSNLTSLDQFKVGQYNGYQHHLELSTEDDFYFFKGINEQEYTKSLVKYSVGSQTIETLYNFTKEDSLVYTNGIIIDGKIVISGSEPFGKRNHKIIELDLETKIAKQIATVSNQIVVLKMINNERALFIDIEGFVGLLDFKENCKVTILSDYLKTQNQTPINLGVLNDQIAVGYDSGTIEILSVETNGR